MGRGKDKVILGSDIKNMSPAERVGLGAILSNQGRVGRVRINGTAVVRSASDGNARYEDPALAGTFNEDKL